MPGGQRSIEASRRFDLSRAVLDDRTCVVEVTGDIDVTTAPDFRDALTEAVEDESSDGIVVDLTGVTFLDSTALNVLVRCLEQQKRRLQGLSVVSTDSRVTTLLEVSRLDQVLRVFTTRNDAIARVSKPI